ncbi:TrkA C-terminal domain-containing protein [Halovivax limisalsi]|uniref:TrkA C-terminal domain-containing protein n=1 Tax=Halovivax limisalsi TaxID=1453760 RepID=UPI001FFD237A|nr:TrkA C-terminal domain-containing protein [Halovivax limisalsi]
MSTSAVGLVLENAVVVLALRVLGLAILSGVVTAVAAFFFARYGGESLPDGPALLVGLGSVAIYLNTRVALVQFLGDGGDPVTLSAAASNLVVLGAAAMTALAGGRFGTEVAESDRFRSGGFARDLSPLVRATGRSIAVELPEVVADIEGYDPVAEETRTAIAGTTLHFPRGLTVEELEAELATRLKARYDVGTVDADITADGTVEYLAVGQRAAGLAPTIPPGYEVTAVTADPPRSASPGDAIQLWRAGERVASGEVRATAGRTVTLVGVEGAFDAVDPTASYRLVTLPADSRIDREFVTALRRAEQTTSEVSIEAESPLVGRSVRDAPGTIVAIRTRTGELVTIPDPDRRLEAGDVLSVLGLPATLRALASEATETAAEPDPTGPDVESLELER